jgi:hypothetical protein
MGHMTEAEIDALQATNLDRGTPFAIGGVSQSQLSITRHYGGCKFQGRNYSYFPMSDELLRDDVVKWLAKHRKAQKKVGADNTPKQQDLMIPNVEVRGDEQGA